MVCFHSEVTFKNYTTLVIESLGMRPRTELTVCYKELKTVLPKTSRVFFLSQNGLVSGLFFFCFFETGSHYVALTDLKFRVLDFERIYICFDH